MPEYDVYRRSAFTFEKAYRRDSLHYKLVYYLITRQGYEHIATCEATSKRDAIRKATSSKYDTQPIPYVPFSFGSLFSNKQEIPALDYAEVMAYDRQNVEIYAAAFVMGNYGEISEHRRQETVIFSYLVELLSLQMSIAEKVDIQRLMIEFTGLTNVFTSEDSSGLKSSKALQEAILSFHSTTAVPKKQTDVAMFLIFEFFERAEMEELVRIGATEAFVDWVDTALTERISRNNTFLSKFKVAV